MRSVSVLQYWTCCLPVPQFGVVSVSDCGNCVCIGSWLRKVADEIRFCTPVLDMLSTSAQFGVVSVSDEDHKQICQ